MYAVIKAGGKQQKVKQGDVIEVELMHGAHGEDVTFTPILVVDDDGKTHVGRELTRAVVKGKLLGEEKGDKVKIFKYRPKTGFAKRQGHRQMFTLVEIEDVTLAERGSTRKAAGTKVKPKTEAPAAAAEPATEEPAAREEPIAAGEPAAEEPAAGGAE